MQIRDILELAWCNICRRPLRSALSILGMSIGTAALLVMFSLGAGVEQSISRNIGAGSALTLLRISTQATEDGNDDATAGGRGGAASVLDQSDIYRLAALPQITAVTPASSWPIVVKKGNVVAHLTLVGIDMKQAGALGLAVENGQSLLPADTVSGLLQIWLTDDCSNIFAETTFQPQQEAALTTLSGEYLQFSFDVRRWSGEDAAWDMSAEPPGQILTLYVADVLADGFALGYTQTAFADWLSLRRWLLQNRRYTGYNGGPESYDCLLLQVQDATQAIDTAAELRKEGYQVYSAAEYIATFRKQTRLVQAALAIVGGISLAVALIGVVNTMITAFYERIAEIGIFKTLGCSTGDVGRIFLCEAALLGAGGGVWGTLCGWILAKTVSALLPADVPLAFSVPWWLAMAAVVFSTGAAMLAGGYPALQGMRLSPLAAMRGGSVSRRRKSMARKRNHAFWKIGYHAFKRQS